MVGTFVVLVTCRRCGGTGQISRPARLLRVEALLLRVLASANIELLLDRARRCSSQGHGFLYMIAASRGNSTAALWSRAVSRRDVANRFKTKLSLRSYVLWLPHRSRHSARAPQWSLALEACFA